MTTTETDIRFGQNATGDKWWWKFLVDDKTVSSGEADNRTEALAAARAGRQAWEERDPGLTCETCGGIVDSPSVVCPNCELGDA